MNKCACTKEVRCEAAIQLWEHMNHHYTMMVTFSQQNRPHKYIQARDAYRSAFIAYNEHRRRAGLQGDGPDD